MAAAFDHLAHVRMAWGLLKESPSVEDAVDRMRSALHQKTAAAGVPEKYHETLTRFWMYVLADVLVQSGPSASLDDVLAREPRLLDKDLPFTFYSRERLMSEEARRTWIPPPVAGRLHIRLEKGAC